MGEELMGGMNEEDLEFPDEGPVLKEGEEKEIGKQGLKKKLVKEGQGWETPENGDEVEGTYCVAPKRNPPFVILLFQLLFGILIVEI